jgi:hypothetical protein
MPIRHVVLDFDGTCTQVPVAQQAYLDLYRKLFREEVCPTADAHWDLAVQEVRSLSPHVGWMLDGAAPSAPAAADPFILAGEVAKRILFIVGSDKAPLGTLHQRAYEAAQAPWRDEVLAVLTGLVEHGVQVHFVSNSSTTKIAQRLDDLTGNRHALRARLRVDGGAAKFSIRELAPHAAVSRERREQFLALAPGVHQAGLDRPVYLRRGRYFEALCHVWGADPGAAADTLVCGDVWELDLAMPAALGCQVHLVTRGAPFETYPYEIAAALAAPRGGVSDDLTGMLDRVRAGAVATPPPAQEGPVLGGGVSR